MIFYKIFLRTKTKQSIIAEKSTSNEIIKDGYIKQLEKEMSRWDQNTTLFLNDPLEIFIEEKVLVR